MTVRDAAVADIVPKMSETEGYGNTNNARLVPYNLGPRPVRVHRGEVGQGRHPAVHVLAPEERHRRRRRRVRRSVQDDAGRIRSAFDRYLKERFKPFRDKERPADYGRDLAPNRGANPVRRRVFDRPVALRRPDRRRHRQPEGSGAGHRARLVEGRLDRPQPDPRVRQGHGLHPHRPAGRAAARCRGCRGRRSGDRLAYFVRTEKERTLIVQNVLTRKIEMRIPMKTVDEPESPSFSPDGRTVAFAGAARRASATSSRSISRPRRSSTSRTTTSRTPRPASRRDGKFLIYNARVSGNQKLFRLDLDTKKKTQITFGTVDETAAQFIDDNTIVFSSTATDPAVPLDPEVARNGNIYNIWTLDLRTGELRQFTDVLGGNWSPDRAERGPDLPHRLHQLLQGRVQHPHARAEGAAAHWWRAPTSARRARSSTSRRRCSTR